jgi:hypothetical protein
MLRDGSKIIDGGLVATRQASPGDESFFIYYVVLLSKGKKKTERKREKERKRGKGKERCNLYF